MKKLIKIITLCVIMTMFCGASYAENYESGAYYELGKYNGNPIIWRCVSTDDENGVLMVSDKILCYKAANVSNDENILASGKWEDSCIRTWLNSKDYEVEWHSNVPSGDNLPQSYEKYAYDSESGFLSDKNFSESELSVLKSVSQWQALPIDELNNSANGDIYPFIADYSHEASHGDWKTEGWVSVEDFKNAYKGAMYRISDTVFLLNEPQAYSVYEVYGEYDNGDQKNRYENSYWLRTPFHEVNEKQSAGMTWLSLDYMYGGRRVSYPSGIRPAFYLNEKTAVIKSGSGTEDEPYILDGVPQEGIAVFINGKQLEFYQPSVIENDRTLVGMRAVFESLGADVEWNGDDRSVTAVSGDIAISLQIDNNIMQVNDSEVELDAPARLINDNTMVPLRAVSEALGTKVDWIEAMQRVVIDKQPEWTESDWAPEWYMKAMRVGGYLKE